MSLNLIDALLCLIVLLSLLFGWYRGFILGIVDLIRWIGGLVIGLRYYQPVARWMAAHIPIPEVWDRPIAFLLTAAVAGLVIQVLLIFVVRRFPESIHERKINRILGLLPGFINGVIFAAIVAPILMALPLSDSLRGSTRDSQIANRLAVVSDRLESTLSPVFDDAVRQSLNLLTVRPEPESSESVNLPFTVKGPAPKPDLEARMLALVNEERAKQGLKPLVADPELTQVARQHSADMFARGYFSHYSPEGKSPFDRMHDAGVKYSTAGENLALAPTLTIAHNGLMNSPGHRANILRPQFGRVGIGVMDGGSKGLMISQEFRN